MRFELRPGFVALACGLYYISPGRWFWPFFTLCAAHELAHLLALRALGVRTVELRLGLLGAELKTGLLSPRQELWGTLTGPAANVLLAAVLLRPLPRWAVLSALLAAFNLLPAYPLDGGRLLRLGLQRRLPADAALRAELGVTLTLGLAVAALGLHGAVRGPHGLWPLLLAAALLLRVAACRADI